MQILKHTIRQPKCRSWAFQSPLDDGDLPLDAATLKQFGQEHVLKFVDELTEAERTELESQLCEVNFEELQQLAGKETKAVDWAALSAKAEPPPAVKLDTPHSDFPAERAREVGEAAIRAGKVGMILVAGGQGTRLGFDKPKGMFPIGPVSGRTLFQVHCDRLLAVMKRYGVSIPLYVMTSPATDSVTKEYFEANERCGLSEEQLQVFCQGTMPAVDQATGKLLLASKNSLALSPDGHGGLVAALDKSGCLASAKANGIEYLLLRTSRQSVGSVLRSRVDRLPHTGQEPSHYAGRPKTLCEGEGWQRRVHRWFSANYRVQ